MLDPEKIKTIAELDHALSGLNKVWESILEDSEDNITSSELIYTVTRKVYKKAEPYMEGILPDFYTTEIKEVIRIPCDNTGFKELLSILTKEIRESREALSREIENDILRTKQQPNLISKL